jgi:hypothetical protein
MMSRLFFFLFLDCLALRVFSQTTVYRDTIPVYELGSKLENPWAGGINFSSFSSVDLNLDGKKDIVAFDKMSPSGFGKLRAYLNVGSAGVAAYKHAPKYEALIPKVEDWALFIDFDNDGRADLFTYTTGGIKVFKNISTVSTFSFVLVKSLIVSDYNPTGSPNISNIYCNSVALPGIADIDGDGDLDILTYSVFGVKIEYHKNMSMELFGHADSLRYNLQDNCWGDIQETTCAVYLNQCPYPKLYNELINSSKVAHAGSCIMCIDRDGDGDQDAILGDVSCSEVFYIENTGSSSNAHISDTTAMFPNYPIRSSVNRIKLNSYPCTYYLDIDNDGFKDLLASPNTVAGAENFQSVWYYKNTSTTPTVNFSFQKKNFLQDGMIELGEGSYPVLFDADSDGKKDLLIGNLGYYNAGTNSSKIAYYRNIGSVSVPSFSLITRDYQGLSIYGLYSVAPTFGDLDGDGDQDLIIGQSNGQLAFFENTASVGLPASFSTPPTLFYEGIDVGSFAFPQLYDVDKNGLLDLVIGSSNGRLAQYRNVGTSTSAAFSLSNNFFGNVDVKHYGSLTGFSTPFMFDDAGVTKMIVGSEFGNLFYYTNIDGNISGAFNRVDTNLFKINEGVRCAPFYEDVTNDGKRDLFLGNYAGGIAFFNSANVNSVGIVDKVSEKSIKVFPNPVKDELSINFDSNTIECLTYTITDVLGNEIYKIKSFNKNIRIQTSDFADGIYFLSIHTAQNSQVYQTKIIFE